MTSDDAVQALGKAILGLPKMPPARRAARARALITEAKAVLSVAGDAAVNEAVTLASYQQVAAEMGVSTSAVNKAVTRHRVLNRSKSAQHE